ncbi:hypothetical protein AB1L88_05920 [Tautonia sp. JC769]|uniref:hypothetical protein n=1 Tax=Tautonia sp. JC769 TaxID=3232135 RepID=UPI0034598CF5
MIVASLIILAPRPALDPQAGRASEAPPGEFDEALEQSLRSMLVYHDFSVEEMAAATGRPAEFVRRALDHFELSRETRPELPDDGRLLILPYPGGRHPRLGFLDGAIDPRADTKVSLISPWGGREYVVVDLPEAIWWEDELLFLAHTHIPTLWTEAGIELGPQPWARQSDRSLSNRRRFPNGVTVDAKIVPVRQGVVMELSLTNHGEVPLRDLRAQVCVLLRGLSGFDEQSADWDALQAPYAARRSQDRADRWLVTAWDDCQRAWANPDCPCLHSDPKFPDCPPGQTVKARGVIAFVEAADFRSACDAVDRLNWDAPAPGGAAGDP